MRTSCSRPTSGSRNLLACSPGSCEVGTVESFHHGRLVVESELQAELGDSVAIDGVCLTVVESRTAARVRRRARDARPLDAARGRASTSSPRCAPATRSAATSCRATSTASAESPVTPEATASRAGRPRPRGPPLPGREGLGRRGRRLADRLRARGRRLRGRADPAHARGHDARARSPADARSTSRWTCWRSTSSACWPRSHAGPGSMPP